jgi:hypothetical protein
MPTHQSSPLLLAQMGIRIIRKMHKRAIVGVSNASTRLFSVVAHGGLAAACLSYSVQL